MQQKVGESFHTWLTKRMDLHHALKICLFVHPVACLLYVLWWHLSRPLHKSHPWQLWRAFAQKVLATLLAS